MKRLNRVSPISGKFALPLKHLVVAMAAMVALPVAQADVAGKKIGDVYLWKLYQFYIPIKTTMIKPIRMIHWHGVSAARVINLNHDEVFTRYDMVRNVSKKWC